MTHWALPLRSRAQHYPMVESKWLLPRKQQTKLISDEVNCSHLPNTQNVSWDPWFIVYIGRRNHFTKFILTAARAKEYLSASEHQWPTPASMRIFLKSLTPLRRSPHARAWQGAIIWRFAVATRMPSDRAKHWFIGVIRGMGHFTPRLRIYIN